MPPQSYRWTLNGTEEWLVRDGVSTPFYYTILSKKTVSTGVDFICTHFEKDAPGRTFYVFVKDNYCRAYVTERFTTVEEWIAYLEEQARIGNPVTFEYATEAVPEPIDISAYLPNDNFIAVEGCGALTFVNEHKQPVPSTIQYLYKTEGE